MTLLILLLILIGTRSGWSYTSDCCKLTPWATNHMDVVKILTDQIKQVYFEAVTSRQDVKNPNQAWSENFATSIGKSTEEINAVVKKLSDQIIEEVHEGRLPFLQVRQPNYFEARAADVLEKLTNDSKNVATQKEEDYIFNTDVLRRKLANELEDEIKSIADQLNEAYTRAARGQEVKKINPNWSENFNDEIIAVIQKLADQIVNEFHESDKKPATLPVPMPTPMPSPWPIPLPAPLPTPMPVPLSVLLPAPLPTPMPAPIPAPLPKLWPAPLPIPLHVPMPTPMPSPWPVPLPAPLPKPLPAPFPTPLPTWRENETKRILQKISQNQRLTFEELENQIKVEHHQLQLIAQQNQITVNEIEEWIRKEGRRLIKLIPLTPWKQAAREYLLTLARNNTITKKTNFEDHLTYGKATIARVASSYKVTVEEINDFLRKEYQSLLQSNLISGGEDTGDVYQWQGIERKNIDLHLKKHSWSIEELARELVKDKNRLQQLALQYHITVDEIKKWYSSELQNLLQKKNLQSENLTDWQKREKLRLYSLILANQEISIDELKLQLKNNVSDLAGLYRITDDKLIKWQREEVKRLNNLGYWKPLPNLKNWETVELKRLQMIANKIIITRQELLEFIESDSEFQNKLASKYKVSTQNLLMFQNQSVQMMEENGLLQILKIKNLEDGQRRERDYIYNIIYYFANKQTVDKDNKINQRSSRPYERHYWETYIEKLARNYNMSLDILEDFRHKEMERLKMVAHKDDITEADYDYWSKSENTRLKVLEDKTKLTGAQLDQWRRKLYLLAQGLIDFTTF